MKLKLAAAAWTLCCLSIFALVVTIGWRFPIQFLWFWVIVASATFTYFLYKLIYSWFLEAQGAGGRHEK